MSEKNKGTFFGGKKKKKKKKISKKVQILRIECLHSIDQVIFSVTILADENVLH